MFYLEVEMVISQSVRCWM